VYRPRVDERHDGGREDRPNNVRERERMPSLDTRQMDVRRRDGARESGRMQPRSLGSEEQRSADRNSRWFEVTPPRVNQDVERPVDPGVRSGRNTERPVDRSTQWPQHESAALRASHRAATGDTCGRGHHPGRIAAPFRRSGASVGASAVLKAGLREDLKVGQRSGPLQKQR
jgi:hypothetical protein